MALKPDQSLEIDTIELLPFSDRISRSYEHRASHDGQQSNETPSKQPLQDEDLARRLVRPVDIVVDDLSVVFRAKAQAKWFPQIFGLELKSRDLEAPVSNKTKVILDHLSADLKAGTLTAILGGSGSGKTTLLNTIATVSYTHLTLPTKRIV